MLLKEVMFEFPIEFECFNRKILKTAVPEITIDLRDRFCSGTAGGWGLRRSVGCVSPVALTEKTPVPERKTGALILSLLVSQFRWKQHFLPAYLTYLLMGASQ